MPKIITYREEIERTHGKPIRDILIEVVEKKGSATGAAQELGVTQGTVSIWLKASGLKLKTIAVPMEAAQHES